MKKRIGNLAESDGRITVEVSVIVPVFSLLITGAVFLRRFFWMWPWPEEKRCGLSERQRPHEK